MEYTIYYRTKQENLLTHTPMICTGTLVVQDFATSGEALVEAEFILESEADEVEVSLEPIQ